MAQDLLLDTTTHDLDVTNLQISLTEDSDGQSLAQRLKINLLTNLKEWVFNESIGVPYLRSSSDQFQQFILSDKTNDLSVIDTILREHILKVEGVSQLIEFSSEFDKATRAYTFTFTVSDINGTLVNLSLVA
jgi:hypothetical protein